MSSARDPTSRLRAGLNPLLTTSLGVGGYHNQAGTPVSAVSYTSNTPFSAQTPVSAIQPYNPQEWMGSPLVAADQRQHALMDAQQSPPPPPPYSPPRSQRPVSVAYESPAANTSACRAPLPGSLRPSPESNANPAFAPPPGSSGRGASRDRRFGLPSFGRRREEQAITPPDIQPPRQMPTSITSSRQQPVPLTLQIPQTRPAEAPQNAPPGSRRAVSTPATITPTSARSRSASQLRWEPGMPLPPPPPGPPPASSRSQSASRPSSGSEPIVSPPTRRPPPSGVAELGPVPPTPADWVDDSDARSRSPAQTSTEESISSVGSPSSSQDHSASGSSPAGGLARTGAVRGEKTLLARRNESRTRHGVRGSIDGSLEGHRLSEIVIPPSGGLTRKLTINKSTPRSGRGNQETPQSGDSASLEYYPDSRNITPRATGSSQAETHPGTPTPPFSPHPQKPYAANAGPSGQIAPKALPTPPPHTRSASSSQTRLTLEPIAPGPQSPRLVTKESVVKQSPEQFCRGTIERYKAFAHKETAAADDAERVRLFADFIVNESRIRRERYSTAIGAMGSEIFDLTRDLFRPMAARRESVNSQISAPEFTPQSSEPSRSHRGSFGSVSREAGPSSGPSSAPASANLPPLSPVTGPQNQGNYQSNYMPSLSPILSMSVSDNVDEDDSRGRPSSRWWETDSNGVPGGRLERSKRESKYMGVPKEAREALQWMDRPSSFASSSKRDSTGEYPPEKTGWHDQLQENISTPKSHLRNSLVSSISSPNTPNASHMDVSRLVTLPPPYPRHHPAVNNNHPELTSIRTAVRAISDFSEIEATNERFKQKSKAMREEAAEAAKKRKQELRMNLQREISCGNMSYSEAAAIESDSNDAEKGQLKELERKDFDHFQNAVVMPLNELLTARIAKATELFDELRGRLFVETRQANPNMPQEEGDEQPELLEKLTLLKWIFEARETLHRAIYDLLSDRNDRYKEMIITPYRLAGNEEKMASAEAFFAEDAAKRALAFSEEVFRRTQEFRDVVEESAMRGVEVQLSAFWDLAPPLKRVLDKIPQDLQGFHIQIPADEYDETPSYRQHPMQYLFSLLLHAEKSSYQFIESQTNLLCLLHQVKEALATAKAMVMEKEGRDRSRVEETRREEERRLTDDLKEKVRVVQEQWSDALGGTIGGVKERLGEWLLETGGWDESLEDEGVGASGVRF
ncbi:uncharacterized protein E0L32_011495 [Thyridium curvatum]|uniref:Uncharacterized protein n=1 Tax=Thyridium curvatum TaxID=1093900 RepID=A0A507BHH0_9PEZI|nr:uncharacterized protein E0L32_011495 [Thyridium curvatum]TPX18816.1 hypothetical protein E0L32_011495 [Thyridium curvatum]